MGNTSAYKAPMSWNPKNTMSLRLELVTQARAGGVPFAELCRRFGATTGAAKPRWPTSPADH